MRRYARVIVFRKNPDGSDIFPPATANVDSFNPDFPTPLGISERIPWSGDARSAQQRAYERAKSLSRGQFTADLNRGG